MLSTCVSGNFSLLPPLILITAADLSVVHYWPSGTVESRNADGFGGIYPVAVQNFLS